MGCVKNMAYLFVFFQGTNSVYFMCTIKIMRGAQSFLNNENNLTIIEKY